MTDHEDKLAEAYEYGFDLTDGASLADEIDEWAEMDEDERMEEVSFSEDGFTSTAQYANSVLPDLREMAGCEDSMGTGSYQDCSDESMYVFEELVDAFFVGYADGLLDRDAYPERAL